MIDLAIFFFLGGVTWRIGSLLAFEKGAFGLFPKLRRILGVVEKYDEDLEEVVYDYKYFFSEGVHCIWCNSIWIAPIVVLIWYKFDLDFTRTVFYSLFVSFVAIVIQSIIEWLKREGGLLINEWSSLEDGLIEIEEEVEYDEERPT